MSIEVEVERNISQADSCADEGHGEETHCGCRGGGAGTQEYRGHNAEGDNECHTASAEPPSP